MRPSICRLIVAAILSAATLSFATGPLSAQGACSTPLQPPARQGGGKSPPQGQVVYGIQAVITNGYPTFNCPSNWDSYTNEWIMVVGPGDNAWIQVGWERSPSQSLVHIWCQVRSPSSPGPREVHFNPDYRVDIPRAYSIVAYHDPRGFNYWGLWTFNGGIDGTKYVYLDSIYDSELQWPGGSAYAIDAQWSGEVSYIESQMGGTYASPSAFYYPRWYLGDPSGEWPYITDPRTFNSRYPKYGGDAFQYADGTWRFRNWTWSNFLYLPLILKNH